LTAIYNRQVHRFMMTPQTDPFETPGNAKASATMILAGRSARDEEPLVNAGVNNGRLEVLVAGKLERAGVNALRGSRNRGVCAASCQRKKI
jgi:hypothetical protein